LHRLLRKRKHVSSIFSRKYKDRVRCWLSEAVMHVGQHVSGESEEEWDLTCCIVVLPKKMDRFRLRMHLDSPAPGDEDSQEDIRGTDLSGNTVREVSLRAGSVREAQEWVRKILAAKEVALAEQDFNRECVPSAPCTPSPFLRGVKLASEAGGSRGSCAG
jgi:hypothetical protein